MAKVLKFGKRQVGPLPEVEERLAHLQEELALSTAFTNLMLRQGNYKAAAGIISDQQVRLAKTEEGMLRAFARPGARKRRVHAAIAGLAAVMLVGSAAFAALGLHDHTAKPSSAPTVIQDASRRLAAADTVTSSDAVRTDVVEATLNDITSISEDPTVDPTTRDSLKSVFSQQLNLLRHTRSSAGLTLRHKIEELKKKIEDEQVKEAKAKADQKPPASPAPPSAPAAP